MPDEAFAAAIECRLTTTGRTSRRLREVTVWFAVRDRRVLLLAGEGRASHWVRNLEADPRVTVRVGGAALGGRARIVEHGPEDPEVRDAIAAKYGTIGLRTWLRTALPVVVDFDAEG